MDTYKLCAAVLLCCIVCIILKEIYPSFATVASIAGTVLIFLVLTSNLNTVASFASEMISKTNAADSFFAVAKGSAVVLVTEITADICERSGEAPLAKALCTAGKIEIIIIALPLFRTLLETALTLCI